MRSTTYLPLDVYLSLIDIYQYEYIYILQTHEYIQSLYIDHEGTGNKLDIRPVLFVPLPTKLPKLS